MFLVLLLYFQVLGHKEGLNMMEGADPLFLLIGLPMIPVMLVLCKIVRWEDRLLRLWRERLSKWPIFTKLFPTSKYSCMLSSTNVDLTFIVL